jgi:hypothetical protein
MVLIRELRGLIIDRSVIFAKYIEGPDHFDEWYALVREKYPNVTKINCENNKLTEINCPDAIKIVCSNNNIKSLNCPNAVKVTCGYNYLESLNCPNATYIECTDNNLTELNCPNAAIICCCYNLDLRIINAPKLQVLIYDNTINTTIPLDLKYLRIYNNSGTKLNYQKIVEELIAFGRQNTKSARKI